MSRMITVSSRLNDLLKSAYCVAPKKKEALEVFRHMPGLVRWFKKSEVIKDGYLAAINDFFPDQLFHRADLDHSGGAGDTYIVRDVEAAEAWVVRNYPDAVAHSVMSA